MQYFLAFIFVHLNVSLGFAFDCVLLVFEHRSLHRHELGGRFRLENIQEVFQFNLELLSILIDDLRDMISCSWLFERFLRLHVWFKVLFITSPRIGVWCDYNSWCVEGVRMTFDAWYVFWLWLALLCVGVSGRFR